MIVKKCCYPCCNNYAVENHNYCRKHLEESQERRAAYKAFQSAKRYNEKLYNSYKWKKLRSEVIEEQPYCILCGTSGTPDNPLTVDHIYPPKGNEELFFDKYNLQVLCRRCHNKKTNYEVRESKE